MANPSQNKKQAKDSEAKKQSNQPTYGDKPWQTPAYGQKKANKSNSKEDSCGCGSDQG